MGGGFRNDFIQVSREMHGMVHDLVSPICRRRKLTIPQYYMLAELDRNPDQSVSSICERLGIQRTNYSVVGQHLEVAGLVERNRDESDKRSVRLRITGKGVEVLREMDLEIDEAFAARLSAAPEAVVESCATCLECIRPLVSALAHGGK